MNASQVKEDLDGFVKPPAETFLHLSANPLDLILSRIGTLWQRDATNRNTIKQTRAEFGNLDISARDLLFIEG